MSIWTSARRIFNSFIENIKAASHADASHVNELAKYTWQDLQYVLVEVKAERAAMERRVGTLIGAQEKVGLVPGLVALGAAIARFYHPGLGGAIWSPLIQGIVYGMPMLYLIGLWAHSEITKADRIIMLLEMIIDTKKSEDNEPNEGIEPIC
jgi:hypothetical protein